MLIDKEVTQITQTMSPEEVSKTIRHIFGMNQIIISAESSPVINQETYSEKFVPNESDLVKIEAYKGYLERRKQYPTTIYVYEKYVGWVKLFEHIEICLETVSLLGSLFNFQKHFKSRSHNIFMTGNFKAEVNGKVVYGF